MVPIKIISLSDFNITSSKLRRIDFNCGEDQTDLDLNIYLKKNALNHSNSGYSCTYVAVDDSENIIGYYTISACSIQFDPLVVEKLKLPPFPIPFALIGKLAVTKEYQRKGIGNRLIYHAYSMAIDLSRICGIYGIYVESSDEKRLNYYIEKHGFIKYSDYLAAYKTINKIKEDIS